MYRLKSISNIPLSSDKCVPIQGVFLQPNLGYNFKAIPVLAVVIKLKTKQNLRNLPFPSESLQNCSLLSLRFYVQRDFLVGSIFR